MSKGDPVHLFAGVTPPDYHCTCDHCRRVIGELRPSAGGYYSRLERREYYDKSEQGPGGHVAKTPLHVARWLVQRYSRPGDWVLDPTIGAGTTAVEAVTQGRNAAGVELQYAEVVKANLKLNLPADGAVEARVRAGDARRIGSFLEEVGKKFALVVSNPPYSGDEHAGTGTLKQGKKSWTTSYESGKPNLAFLREDEGYWSALGAIYDDCVRWLEPGGTFAFAVKDMMRNKKPYMLHQSLNALLGGRGGLVHEGTAFLKHHPGTLHLHTYEKRFGVPAPLYQTISVFKKVEAD